MSAKLLEQLFMSRKWYRDFFPAKPLAKELDKGLKDIITRFEGGIFYQEDLQNATGFIKHIESIKVKYKKLKETKDAIQSNGSASESVSSNCTERVWPQSETEGYLPRSLRSKGGDTH